MTNVYIRTFTSPLIALAFKDGVELGDNLGFFKVDAPKLEKPNKWVVRVEDHTDDEEDEEENEIIEIVEPKVIRRIEARDMTTSKKVLRPDFVRTTPAPITPRLKDINTPAIQSAVVVEPKKESCACWNCKAGIGDCMTDINAEVARMNGRER